MNSNEKAKALLLELNRLRGEALALMGVLVLLALLGR